MSSSLDLLKTRIAYHGSNVQETYEKDKLRSLKSALKYSYQSEDILLEDGREFKCLINPDKLKENYDEKMLSIPFEDICLNKERIGKTSAGIEPIGLKAGDVVQWKKNGSYWLVYMRQQQETAQFKAAIRRCRHTITINDKSYHIYIDQPAVQSERWTTKQDRFSWNDLNFRLQLLVTRDENTSKYFQRFTQVKIDGDTWEVVSSNELSVEGVIVVYLREYFNNPIADAAKEGQEKIIETTKVDFEEEDRAYIEGETKVYPYEIYTYNLKNIPADGTWSIDNKKDARILKQSAESVTIEIIAGKTDKFNLIYTRKILEDVDETSLNIEIKSL